ncbi:hypothetical protein FT663_05140 [Candidozyma haemuli var. vulneris]|uniref:Autophagy-related protein 18 n=1 Tax=Candidozyma haemuli TaxID=45357 RepID=A0A2V1ASE6_9ASCO|nr:hypothetical protein CXQ85_002444 [[Candida] haemuloni]KAF3985845.1 hypothetical protein FT663_05140 [[Candida] haemuloni var. vulneris]PVH20644.1 hypothetical protein CXQ85_002444 [[Candida] haemuloni]
MLKTSVAASPAYMNLAQQYQDSLSQGDEGSLASNQSHHADSTVKYITFNQDSTCVAVGLNNGYKVYSMKPSLAKCHSLKKEEAVGIVEMLYCTSLLAIVALGDEPGSSPRKLKIVNTKDNSIICDLIFPTAILAVRLSRHRVVVLLEEQIYIYDILSMQLLHTIETSPNTNRLCALSDDFEEGSSPDTSMGSRSSASFLAYPSPPKTVAHESLIVNANASGNVNSSNVNAQAGTRVPKRVGDVIIFDLHALQPVVVIEAHKSGLAALCLSRDGHLLATASNKGTIVRVFSVDSGEKLYQFRRGTYPTKIYSLSFSSDNKYVVATSSSETVHIFRLGEDELLANKQKRKRESKTKKMRLNPEYTINEEDEDSLKKAEEEEDFIEDDGDDSDAEGDGDNGNIQNAMDAGSHRKLSQGSTNSLNSGTSGFSNISGNTEEHKEKNEPVVDQSRLSVARLIRRSSQNLGRKAAQKMGDFLPSRFSSILEPTRHFASLKIQTIDKDVKSIATMNGEIQEDLVPPNYMLSKDAADSGTRPTVGSPTSSASNKDLVSLELVHINVVTSEGFFYTYGLDPERGGDCILLNQVSLLSD